MLVFSAVVLTLVVSDVIGQDQANNCDCVVYFECTGTIIENDSKCEVPYFVCCAANVTTPDISVAQTSPPPPLPEGTTEEPIRYPPDTSNRLCGKRGQRQVSVGFKVFGDDVNTNFGEFPWMVAIMKTSPTGRRDFLCGGSIIHPNIILTAAHCVSSFSERDLLVKAGVWDTLDPEEVPKHQDRVVSQILIQPGYDGREKQYANDLAILVLSQPLTLTDNVGTVCLPSSERQLNTTRCVATGWGRDNYGKNVTSTFLKKVDIGLVNFNSCQNQLRQINSLGPNFRLHYSFLCAGGGKADTCKGDGGGPLMCPSLDDPSYYTQVGVTSWGVECGLGPPGVYSSIQVAAGWIEDIVKGNSLVSDHQKFHQ